VIGDDSVHTTLIGLSLLVVGFLGPAWGAGQERQVRLNGGWYYLEDSSSAIGVILTGKKTWQAVTLPHTWNAFDVTDNVPGYRRSAGWYRRELVMPRNLRSFRRFLVFEGANITSLVYVNGTPAGGHVGGYVGFEVDMTPFLRPGKNAIHVRVDNSYNRHVIPSQKSDFFIYGGITRDVWLKTLPPQYIRRVRITTPAVSAESAETAIEVRLGNAGGRSLPALIRVTMRDPADQVVASGTSRIDFVGRGGSATLRLPPLARPRLWSPADPALYRASVVLEIAGKRIDEVSERIGYRWFEFREHGPFFLNGERLLLRGTHRHEEHAGLGSAMPDSLHRRDIILVKGMGGNFLRLAHYPQDPEIYRACDELGILVWDELPWCRGGVGDAEWKANTRRLLREQIIQNANHPSVIAWSLGNELYWLPDFEGGGNTDSLRSFFAELKAIASSLDPSRPVAARKFYEGADLADVFSPSIWAGWYSGVYRDYEKMISEAREKYPHLLHVEYGGDSHLGRHSENPISGEGMTTPDGWERTFTPGKVKNVSLAGDWSEEYVVDLFDWHLHVSESLDWFVGNAQWALKDFGTPLRPENPIPYVNQKGLLDRSGYPKDAYYVFKSYWSVDPKFCYLQSHTWNERSGPPERKRSVRVYSNCAEVELLLNGKSLGRKLRDPRTFPAGGLLWDLLFAEGANALAAVGFDEGKRVAGDSLMVHYSWQKSGEPDDLKLVAEKKPDGTYLVTATALDKNGLRCLAYNKKVYFVQLGPGRLLQDYGTSTRSAVIEMANGKAQIEFVPDAGMTTTIEARTMELRGSYCTIKEE